MKKWLSLAAIVVLFLAVLVGVGCGGEGEDEEKEVKLGMGLPLAGIYGAAVGIAVKQACELTNDYIGEFTVAGERYKWKLIFEDNGYSSAGGVASATKLVFEDGVNIMHQAGADPALSAQTICEEAGVILLTAVVPLDALGPDKPHTFMLAPYINNTAVLFRYVSEAHPEVKTASAVAGDDATDHALVETMAMAAEHYGIEWLDAEHFPLGTVELYPMATKMVTKNPDLCYMDIRVLAPMRELGWEGISFYTIWGSAWGEMVGWEKVQGHLLYYPAPFGEGLPEALKDMAAEYQQRFGAEFAQLALDYVVRLYTLTDVLKKAGTVNDVDKIMATLETESFDTPVGPVRFGLSELDGIGHLFIMPCWIGEIRGEEYHVVFEMSTDEVEALATDIFAK